MLNRTKTTWVVKEQRHGPLSVMPIQRVMIWMTA